ncbi:MAG TPA: 3'-5' exonuclease [Polaromonas sp.]|uniref:3'-5' exonuclease n=1 Tax=Polaromonas sp. TaxID=1869339 RepID=UPI002D613304|nr:3'-5' exonuclease [Polaromonas sp.]HYW57143.1 3'-5' exonuclease [Polaromonas sp.]
MSEASSQMMSSGQLGFGFEDAAAGTLPPALRKARKSGPVAVQPQTPEPEAMARLLEAHPDYRVLRRLPVQLRFAHQPTGPVTRVLILDTETTGLYHARDRIIELALLAVDVETATGLPTGEVEVYNALEDPGMPISKEVQGITGINDEMVRGHRLDEQRVASMLLKADLVLAHNAGFDRPFVEARMAQFSRLPWACSFADLDWKKEGRSSAKLSQLALELGWFYDAHRAEMDCHALLAVLACQLPLSGHTGLAGLLAVSVRTSYRLQATAAPFEAKDLLRARGYRWDADIKVWQIKLGDENSLRAECQWLKTSVYAGRSARVQLEQFDASSRYSARPGIVTLQAL